MTIASRRLLLTTVAGLGVVGLCATSANAVPPPLTPHRTVTHSTHSRAGNAATPHNPRLKEVLAEHEHDSADAPTLIAQCQKFIGKPNPYRNPAPDVDMIVNDGVNAVGSAAGCPSPQNETTIASNPENPANIVAGANDYRLFNARENRNDSSGFAYTSTDGGLTWTDVVLPGLTLQTGAVGALSAMDSAGDPIVAFGKHNTVFYGNIAFSRGAPGGGGTEAPSAIVVNVSHDGGLTFGQPSIVQLDGADSQGNFTRTHVFNDKIWMAVDPATNQLYVTWTRFLDDKSGGFLEAPIVISTSIDDGATFSHFRRIDTAIGANNPGLQPFSQGSNPRVASDGTLYVAYETEFCQTGACDRPTDRDVTVVATSKNHGRTFARSIVGTNFDFPATLTGENFRINSFPQLTVDPITSQLVVTWADDRNGSYDPTTGASIKTNGDNIVSSSTNGITWTRLVAVGSPQDEFFGAVASYGGTVALASYTRRYQPGKALLDFAYWPLTATAGHPVSAGSIVRVTTQSSDPKVQFAAFDAAGHVLQGVFIGDYAAVSMGADRVLHPAWTDFRGNPGTTTPNQDAYTRSIPLS